MPYISKAPRQGRVCATLVAVKSTNLLPVRTTVSGNNCEIGVNIAPAGSVGLWEKQHAVQDLLL